MKYQEIDAGFKLVEANKEKIIREMEYSEKDWLRERNLLKAENKELILKNEKLRVRSERDYEHL